MITKHFRGVILLAVLAASIVFIATTPIKADSNSWPNGGPSVKAKSAILVEPHTNIVLYEKDAYKMRYPASITKIMTALLTIENCKMDEKVTFSKHAVHCYQVDNAANVGAKVGEKMTVKDCLYALMLHSANEVATALGEHIAGSESKFADMMNKRAKQAGAKGTHFKNANGLFDKNHYTTAYDMAMIMKAAVAHPEFVKISSSTEYTIPKDNKRKKKQPIFQRHKMLWKDGPYYVKGATAGKTGYTVEAGNTLVTYAKRNNLELITVILKSDLAHEYDDTRKILEYGFDNFSYVNCAKNNKSFSEQADLSIPSPFTEDKDSIYIDPKAYILLPKGTDFSKVQMTTDFKLKGNKFADIKYKYVGKNVGSSAVFYKKTPLKLTAAVIPEETTTLAGQQVTKKTPELKEGVKNVVKDVPSKFSSLSTFFRSLKTWHYVVAAILLVVIICFIAFMKHLKKLKKVREEKRYRVRYTSEKGDFNTKQQ